MDPGELYDWERDGETARIVLLQDSFFDRDELDTMFNDIERRIKRKLPKVVVFNFRYVNNLSSVFIGKVLALHKRLEKQGSHIELTDVNGHVFEIFTLTRVAERFKVSKLEPAVPVRRGPHPAVMWGAIAGAIIAMVCALLVIMNRG
jgi:anti-anti-sigma regulatory factor